MKNKKFLYSTKIELPPLDFFRKTADNPDNNKPRCKCGKFLGNSNLGGSNGRLNDSLRGECQCENCVCREVLSC